MSKYMEYFERRFDTAQAGWIAEHNKLIDYLNLKPRLINENEIIEMDQKIHDCRSRLRFFENEQVICRVYFRRVSELDKNHDIQNR